MRKGAGSVTVAGTRNAKLYSQPVKLARCSIKGVARKFLWQTLEIILLA